MDRLGFPQGHPGNWTPSILCLAAPCAAAGLLLGEGGVVEIGFSNAPASFLQGFSAFSLYTLPGVRAGSQLYLFGLMFLAIRCLQLNSVCFYHSMLISESLAAVRTWLRGVAAAVGMVSAVILITASNCGFASQELASWQWQAKGN